MTRDHAAAVRERDARLRIWGLRSWYLIGVVVTAVMGVAALSAIAGLVIPLIVASVVAMLFAPSTDVLAKVMPRAAAAAVVLAALVAVMVASLAVAINGVVEQAPEVGRQLAEGFEEIGGWVDDSGWTSEDSSGLVDDLGELWTAVLPSATDRLSTVFSSATSFLVGSLVAMFLLYFGLKDWAELSGWVARHLGVEEHVGRDIVSNATWSVRQYFMALTISSVVVAVIVGGTVQALGLPLAFTIAVVTFATSYVPYLGAIVSGALATVIALGSAGPTEAAVVLIVVLLAQNVVQTLVQTKLTQGRLDLHPIVIFGSTIAGGAVFGVLGAALSTPAVAIAVRVHERLTSAERTVD